MQLATTKAEATRKKLSIKQPEIELYLSEHDLPEKKKKVIMRYLQDIIKEDKDFDLEYLLSLLPEHIDAQHEYEVSKMRVYIYVSLCILILEVYFTLPN